MEESEEPKIDMTNESVPEDVAKNPDLDPNVEMADQEYEVINPNPNQIGILRGGGRLELIRDYNHRMDKS